MKPGAIWPLLKDTGEDWVEDKASRLAGALAYYTLLSLTPLLVLAVSVSGLVFGEEAARGQIAGQLQAMVGPEAGETIQSILASAKTPSHGVIGTVLSGALLLFGASGVFGELQDSLNTIWEVQPKPGRGIMGLVRDRLFSFTMVLGVAFLLLVSLVLSAGLAALGGVFESALPGGEWVWTVVNIAVSLLVISALFALMYKVVPDAEIAYRDVIVGAVVTAVLFTVGKTLIGLYLGKAGVASPFGAAGSVVVIVVWVYYSANIFFLGAEFTQAYARRFGSRIVPTKNAIKVTEEERAQQGMVSDERKEVLAKRGGAGPADVPERASGDGERDREAVRSGGTARLARQLHAGSGPAQETHMTVLDSPPPLAPDAPVKELVEDALLQTKELARLEVELAKREAVADLKGVKSGAIGLSIGLVVAIFGVTLLLVALALLIAPPALGAAIVGGVLLVVAGVVALVGWRALPRKPMERTRKRLAEDARTVKESVTA
ncbi:MAG: YhjD/YihY/BrkB family envelope integrity protein [Polyangiaceae bacterium]